MARYTCLFILLFHFYVLVKTNGSRNTKFRRSLHFAPHLRDELSSPRMVAINQGNQLKQKDIPAFLNDYNPIRSRHKRAASSSDQHEPVNTVFAFNDSHTQMVVHWAGKQSDVIICLTKGHNLASGQRSEHSSHVYVSKNYGENFTRIDDKLTLSNGSHALIAQYFTSPVFNTHYLFADETNQLIFTTQNYGDTITRFYVPFKPKKIVFHKMHPDYALGMDDSDTVNRILYLTRNFGSTWHEIQRDVKSFYWEDEKYVDNQYSNTNHSFCVYVHRLTYNDKGTVIRSCDFFITETIALLNDVHDFEIQHQYMFATKKVRLLGGTGYTHQIWVSNYRGPFYNAEFPHDLTHLDYYIADTSEDQVLMCVNHETSSSHLYVSNVNGTKFSLSLEDILYYNPNGSYGQTWLRYYEDESFADLHKVEGMRGVYIASQLINKTLALDHQRSLITFDKGGEWQLVIAPKLDANKRPTNCSARRHCSLHLSQEFNRVASTYRPRSILSRKSAPGMIIATGNTGDKIHLDEMAGIYMSTDAGWSWQHVLDGMHIFAIADQGGLLVAVIGYIPTNEVVYSTDDGETWKTYKFTDTPIRIHGLLTEPGETTTVLFLFGSNVEQHSWKVISLNMSSIFPYKCREADYKQWSLEDDTSFQGCMLGRKTVYERRISRINCYNGGEYQREIRSETCPCRREDFECDFGYQPNDRFGRTHCVQSPDFDNTEVHAIPENCPIGSFYPYTRGYQKVAGDTCKGGQEHLYAPLNYACPVRDDLSEFIVYTQTETIKRHLFETSQDETLVNEHEAEEIVSVDFAYSDNCLYWADNSNKKIQRLCEDGHHQIEDLHNTSIGQIASIAFDWKGNNIYWIDKEFKTLEVSKKNGRFRRELLRGSQYFDRPLYLLLDPHHGWMYWSDESSSNPRIMKAWMDGLNTSITTVVSGSDNVRRPAGLAIDYETEVLYWTDTLFHRIVAYDLQTNVTTILVSGYSNAPYPYAIGVVQNSIYWTDYIKNSILTADKFTGSGITSIDTNLEGVMDLKIMHRFSQSGGIKACQKDARHCSQLCLLKPGVDNNHGDNRTCRCADNSTRTVFSLGGDETCCFKGKADANGTCIASNGTCDDKHFECTSGRCIPGHWHCDGDNDCGDMSDETNCPYQACTSTQFECNNGRCIVGSWRCDLDDDCHDNSDEEGCTYPACTDDQFRCNNSRCINKAWVCDRDNDCRDDSDEQNCNATVIPCENYEFHCATGWPRCVPNYRVCNGYENCADGSDERNCTGCAAGQFQCDNGNCTRLYWKCDGYDDCGDNSDEINCTTTTPYTSTTHVYTRPYTCRWNQFRCNNGFCIDNRDRCDSLDDCGDYSDEINCGHRTCSPYQFACASGDQCLFRYQHCDGIPQCQDSSDEWYCATTPWPRQCGEMEYRCWNSSNHECIPAASRCDGSRDCNNAEDESGCGGGLSCDPKRMFKCRQSAGCILRRDVCNEKIDCPDGSDEIGCQTTNTTGHTNYTSCTGSHMFHCKFQDKCIPYMFTCDGMPDCYHSSDENLWQCRDIRFTTRNFLKVSEIGKNNFTVEWGAVDGHVTYIFSYIYQGHGGYQGANVTGLNVTHHTVKSLHPAHKYYVVVYVSNSTYIWQPYRRINITTLDDYPDQPMEVTAHYDSTTKLLKASWYPPSVFKGSIRKYRIYVKEVGSIYYLYQDVYSEKNPVFSATLDSEILQLVFGRNYSIVMSAFTMEGEGKKTEPIFVVYAPQCSLSYVGNLTAVGKNNSILLRWNPSGAQVDSYKVVYWDLWNVKREMHTKDGKTTSLLVDNLCSDTVYSFGVVPEKQGCLGDFLYIGAKTNGTKVGIPVVKVDLLDRTKINVSWTPPKGAIPKENYTIFYDYRPEDLHTSAVETHAESLTTSMTFIIVDQLQACDLYTFRVAATGAGRCHLSDGVSQRTAFDVTAPPEEVEVVAIDRTTVNVTWHSSCSVKSEAVGYIITKKEIYGKGTVEVDNPYKFTNRTKMNMTYYNLIPGATYNFTVSTNAKFARSSKPVSISIEGYDAPTDLSQIPTTWNFDSGHLSWKGNRMQVPKTKFKGYQVLLCTIAKLKFNNTCPDEKFKPYGIVQNEFIEFKNLKKGRQYIFAVRVNMINGYYGKMGKFPVFTVPDEENVHGPSETVTLSKTNIIAIAASGVAVVVALGVILAFFIVRHKRLQRSFRAFASSHYDSRSGTTTFTAADELGEDEESPMIRGFSDDEPLVIA